MRKPQTRYRKRRQKKYTRRRKLRGGSEPRVFHFWNQHHYGDNILNLKFLYAISERMKNKGISVKYYYDTEYNKNRIELERYIHPNGVVTLHSWTEKPQDAIQLWMGEAAIDNVRYLQLDIYYNLFYKKILTILGLENEGINTSLYQEEPYLQPIYEKLNDKYKNLDILVVNAHPQSIQINYNKEDFDRMCDTLSKSYKIATTTPVNANITSTMDDKLTLQDIGAISTHAKYIVAVHSGPLTACFNDAAKKNVKKWIIFTNDGTTFNEINCMVVTDAYNKDAIQTNIR